MRILVTGASGFIGRTACARLLAGGHEVIALVRRDGSEPDGTRPVAGDLSAATDLARTLASERPACVVHLAAEIASQRSARKIREVNVASTVVTGDARGALLTEESTLPVQTPYGRSKQEAERLILESGLPVAVLRPSHVYGRGGWYAEELIARLRQPGRFAVIGSGENLWDVVHVQDVAEALLLAAEATSATSVHHVVDDEPITYYDFMALTARELGLGPPRRVPASLARLAIGRHAVAAVVRSARSSNARIKRELGWRPRFPSAEQGVPDAVGAVPG
jgi:nucleoside-diphosphate-sugar epimerase